jgi:hypothetical protein
VRTWNKIILRTFLSFHLFLLVLNSRRYPGIKFFYYIFIFPFFFIVLNGRRYRGAAKLWNEGRTAGAKGGADKED